MYKYIYIHIHTSTYIYVGLEERNTRIAKEAYMLRENRQLQQLQRYFEREREK
jgi:hypothetical protein